METASVSRSQLGKIYRHTALLVRSPSTDCGVGVRNTPHRSDVYMTELLTGWSNKKLNLGRGMGSVVEGWGWLATAVLDSLDVL